MLHVWTNKEKRVSLRLILKSNKGKVSLLYVSVYDTEWFHNLSLKERKNVGHCKILFSLWNVHSTSVIKDGISAEWERGNYDSGRV